MGSAKSKPIANTASKAARSFPSKASPNVRIRTEAPPASRQEDIPGSQRTAQYDRPETSIPSNTNSGGQRVDTDVRDPAFAARLHSLGVVPPNPFIPLSMQNNSSLFNDPSNQNSQVGNSATRSPPLGPTPLTAQAAHERAMASNPALMVLRARQALQKEYDTEQENVGRKGFSGRRFLEAARISDALRMRAGGMSEKDIERRLGLVGGTVGRIGSREVVDVAS